MKTEQKWYAYRPYNIHQCSLFFIWNWEKAYNRHCKRTGINEYFDLAGNLCTHPRPFPALGADIHSDDYDLFSKLRAFADRQCMPYDLYWTFAYQILENEGTEVVSILQNTSKRSFLADLWHERRTSIIVKSKEPWLMAKNFQGHGYQLEYRDYLIDSVKKKYGSRAPEIFGWLIKDGHLLPEWV